MVRQITPIIGVEVHVELTTNNKMFCACPAHHFGVAPNTHTCPVCLGLPGALPVPNRKAVEDTIRIGLALDCQIARQSHFDRKQYFYPDLPKGFQISQYQQPLCVQGKLTLDSGKVIRIDRVHLEEDTGKLQHTIVNGKKVSLIDFNRSGVPLVEIVSCPDLSSSDETKEYLKKIHEIIRALGVSTADMEKGQMRLEPTVNFSIEQEGNTQYTPLVELKNINSFNFVKAAIDFEQQRQISEFDQNHIVKNSSNKNTRGYDSVKKNTFPQREKEEAKDYRYFPEPDIPPIVLTDAQIEIIKKDLPELPQQQIDKLIALGIADRYAKIIYNDKFTADIIYRIAKTKPDVDIGKLASLITNKKIKVTQDVYAQYLDLTGEKEVDRAELEKMIDLVITENIEAISDYRAGKTNVLGFLVGKVMRLTSGRAQPQAVSALLLEKLVREP